MQMFPLNIRARGLSITTSSNWLFNWVVTFVTPYLTDPDRANLNSKVFYLWMGFCAVSIVFVFTMIFETKNLSLEQVDELFRTVRFAWKSNSFRPTTPVSDPQVDTESVVAENERKKEKDASSLHAEHVD